MNPEESQKLNEYVIAGDYPVYGDYFYVAIMKDGSEKVVQSHLHDLPAQRATSSVERQ